MECERRIPSGQLPASLQDDDVILPQDVPLSGTSPPSIPPPPPVFIPPPPPPLMKTAIFQKKSLPKTRRFAWQKTDIGVTSSTHDNIFSDVKRLENGGDAKMPIINASLIQELFKMETPVKGGDKKKKISASRTRAEKENNKKTALLNQQRSLNLNIFLRQFNKSSGLLVVNAVATCNQNFFNVHQLRDLKKYLPEKEELKLLKGYGGKVENLLEAEEFLKRLIAVPNYTLRVESMLLETDFGCEIPQIETSIGLLLRAINDIHKCAALKIIMNLTLQAGNILNHGAPSLGNAAGFQFSSLKKLNETKANKPGITLMHYVQ